MGEASRRLAWLALDNRFACWNGVKSFSRVSIPTRLRKPAGEMQTDLPAHHMGSHMGLFDLRVNDDINVFLGCGLGGTSLINANVALRAEPRVFDDPALAPGHPR